jgi:hypothetical protein
MSSDVIEAIMRRTTNLCGVKLTYVTIWQGVDDIANSVQMPWQRW